MSEAQAPPAPATETPAPAPAEAQPAAPTALTGGGAQPEATQAQPEQAAASVVPEAYEFTAPEIDGKPLEIDAGVMDTFKAQAKEIGLSQAQFQPFMQKVIERGMALREESGKAGYEQHRAERKAEVEGWAKQVMADPEIGGENWKHVEQDVARAIDHFGALMPAQGDKSGAAQLRDALLNTGAGNHPAVIRFLHQIGKAVADPSSLSQGRPVNAGGQKSDAQILYRS